jgi:hypothetical protein
MNWDEEHDAMVKKLDDRRWVGTSAWGVDLILFIIIICVAGWLAYILITAP